MSLLVIRADATTAMGTGHVMRMLALAQAWKKIGGDAAMISSVRMPESLLRRVSENGVAVTFIRGGEPGSAADAEETRECLESMGASVLAADGYGFREEYQAALRDPRWKTL